MKIAVAGSGGFIGRDLCLCLGNTGFDVVKLFHADFLSDDSLRLKLQGCKGIINLAGYPVYKRWTKKVQKRIVESRINITLKLIQFSDNNCDFFISASGIDIYVPSGRHDENSVNFNSEFLGKVVCDWERAADKAQFKFKRVLKLRFGTVLGQEAAAWKKLIFSYKFKIGIIPTDPDYYFSFIHIEDLCAAVLFLINNSTADGAFNFVAPENITYRSMSKILNLRYKAFVIITFPGILVKLVAGKSITSLLGNKNIYPMRLLQSGYKFKYRNFAENFESL